ncbi:MAG: RHS repeat-associated core domain-containing protein [Collimonas sp.]|uniref:RHS repeat-associated core domain-containing protein n=1 Tax=Collimonas sp. TaxID=1963772 RepID=UPI00326332DE
MTNAAKHFDPQIGIDIHMYQLPPGPLPTAHISIVLDPFDYLPFIGATVQVAGVKRAIAGTGGLSVHIPLGIWMPPMRAPEGPQFDDELFMGSKTVLADDSPFSRLGMPVLDCSVVGMVPPFRLKKPEKPHMSMSMPTAVNLAIPDTVFIGGPPTISMMAIATKLGFAALGKGFKALRKTKGFQRAEEAFKKARQRLFKNMEPGFLKCKVLRAEPVDIRDGSVAVSHEDFSIPGRLPLTWSRVYSSNNDHDGMCGYGWQTPADFRLEVEPDGVVLFFETNGAAVFPHLPEAAGAEHAVTEFVDGARLSWIKNQGVDELRVDTKDDLRYVFRKPASNVAPLHQALQLQIQKVEDLCGNYWRFERVDGHLTRIIESGIHELPGRFIEVYETAGKIHQLNLHDPATGLNHPLVRYKFQNRDMVGALDALDAVRTFDYECHHLVRHADRLGLSFYYAYDNAWRVVHAWGEQGLQDYRFAYDAVLRETEITDSLGHTSLVKFDEDQLPLCEIDPLGGVTIFEYDEIGRTTAIVDPVGARTEFEYDARGNLLKLVQADGSTVSAEFDERNHVTEVVDPLGHRWQQHWDARGLLLWHASAAGTRTRYEYDASGQLARLINPRGAVTALAFDRYGNLSCLTDPLGFQRYSEHNALGHLMRSVDPVGTVASYRYDAKGRLLQLEYPDSTTSYAYDAEDQLVQYTDTNGATIGLEYFGTGRLARRRQADGHSEQYLYDTEEQLVTVVNQRQEAYHFKRDALGRVVEEIDYWGQSYTYGYDAAGRIKCSRDPLKRTISYDTDKLGRIVRKMLPHPDRPGHQWLETFSYDKRGELIELRNAHRHVLRKFDAYGHLSEEVQDGFRVEYLYDQVGNCLTRTTSAGNITVATFDLANQVASIAINGEQAIEIKRDALGRAVTEKLSADIKRSFQYQDAGLMNSQSVLRNHVPLFETRYEYDSAGNQIRRHDSEQGSDFYQYSPLGELLRHTDPAGRVTEFLNDPAGDRLRTRIQQMEMRTVVGGEGHAETLWTREGSHEGTHYVFDRAGNLIQSSCAAGGGSTGQPGNAASLQLCWDANQRLIESRQGEEITRYGYDPLGRRVFKRNQTHTTWFFWDLDALLGEVTQANTDLNSPEVWSAGNVGDLMAARKRLLALKSMHPQMREYVYYPETFIPLALIDRQATVKPSPPRQIAGIVALSSSLPIYIQKKDDSIRSGRLGGMAGGDGLGIEPVPLRQQSNHQATLGGPGIPVGLGIGGGLVLAGNSVVVPERDIALQTTTVEGTAHVSSNGIFHYHNDPNGCPTRLTDNAGEVVWAASYTAWGMVRDTYANAIDNPLRFQGQYYDTETGLHYNRNRYYDACLGCYVSQDPIGLLGGTNSYQYGPNPSAWADPMGLSARALGRNLGNARRPVPPGQTPHHMVQENNSKNTHVVESRKILERNNVGVDDAANGARLWGTNPLQEKRPGHPGAAAASAVGTRHSGPHIHSDENDKFLYKILRNAERKGADIEGVLRDLGKRYENGSWKKLSDSCR